MTHLAARVQGRVSTWTCPPACWNSHQRRRWGQGGIDLEKTRASHQAGLDLAGAAGYRGSIHCTPFSPASTTSWSHCSWAEVAAACPSPKTPASPLPWVCLCPFRPLDCKTCSGCTCSLQLLGSLRMVLTFLFPCAPT